MDGTLIGVIIGSVLSFLGSFFGNWFTLRKEEKQWSRQQIAEKEKRISESQEADKQFLLNTYHNCINSLSLLVATEFNETIVKVPDDKRLELYRNAHEWLSLVALHHRDNKDESIEAKFHSDLRHFTERADKFIASSLREKVIELSMRDAILFPDESVIPPDNPNDRTITIQIDNEFRKQQFLDGIELPETYKFKIRLEDLTSAQRCKLWDLYFDVHQEIPKRFGGLPIPRYNKEKNQITMRGGNWVALINPLSCSPKKIIRAWEVDYEKALEVAQTEYKAQSETT